MKHVYRILTTLLLLVGSQGQSYGQSASDNAALESYRWRVVKHREAVAVARGNIDFATRHLGDAELAVTEALNPEAAAKRSEIEAEIDKLRAEWGELPQRGRGRVSRIDLDRFATRGDELRELLNQYPHLAAAERHLSVSSAFMLAAQSVLSAQEAAIVSAEALVAAAEIASVSGDTTRLNVALSAAIAVLEAVSITLTESNNIFETDASTHSSPPARERLRLLQEEASGGGPSGSLSFVDARISLEVLDLDDQVRKVDSGSLTNAWSSAARAARAAERAQEIVAALNSGNGVVPPELLEPLPSDPFFSVA